MIDVFAQVPTEWVSPGAQIGGLGVLVYVLQYFMRTIAPQLRSIERALDFNTRATLLMGIAHDEANAHTKAKLEKCLAELDTKEAVRKRNEHDKEA